MKKFNAHTQILLLSSLAAVLLVGINSIPAFATVGDVIETHNLDAVHPAATVFCSIGVAFDGTSLYTTACFDPLIYTVDPLTGIGTGSFDPSIPEDPNAMAYDAKRNGLWIGTQTATGAGSISSCTSTGVAIYFYDFDDASTTLAFNVPSSLINPATGSDFQSFCFVDGLAYNENDATTSADDEIWFSDDITRDLAKFTTGGALITGYDATTIDASLSSASGLAIGGTNLYIGNNGGGDVFRADKNTNPLAFVDTFALSEERTEDMECDPITFAPIEVMWVRHTPQGVVANNNLIAYEIEPNTCGLGGGDGGGEVVVGGSIIPIDASALLIAGAFTNAIWMAPLLVGTAGIVAFYIKTRKN